MPSVADVSSPGEVSVIMSSSSLPDNIIRKVPVEQNRGAACHHQNKHHRACALCQQGGAYRIQLQSRLKIQLDRLDNLFHDLEQHHPQSQHFTAMLPNNNNGKNHPIKDQDQDVNARMLTLISANSTSQPSPSYPPITSPNFLKNQQAALKVVQEYTSEMSTPAPPSHDTPYFRNSALLKTKHGKNLSENNNKSNNNTMSSVEIESARAPFHDRLYGPGLMAAVNKNRQQQAVWEPARRFVYGGKSEFSKANSEGVDKFSRLARSPVPRHLSAKLIQIEMEAPSGAAPAPGHQLHVKVINEASTAPQPTNHIPPCYTKQSNVTHDVSPHNPYINYFKLKQMISEGKLKLKNIPSFEWARIFQPPTSTVMAGDGDLGTTSNGQSGLSTSASPGLPAINRGELVSNWVRKSEMQPLTKFNQLQLEGLGAGSEGYELATPTPGRADANTPLITNGFAARNSAYVKRSSANQKRSKSRHQDEDLLVD